MVRKEPLKTRGQEQRVVLPPRKSLLPSKLPHAWKRQSHVLHGSCSPLTGPGGRVSGCVKAVAGSLPHSTVVSVPQARFLHKPRRFPAHSPSHITALPSPLPSFFPCLLPTFLLAFENGNCSHAALHTQTLGLEPRAAEASPPPSPPSKR